MAAALLNTQTGLYAEVQPQRLSNQDATRAGILRGLATMRQAMARSEPGRDLAVVHFSGHGTLLDGEFYLLPHGVNAGDTVAIKATALPASDLRRELEGLAQYGRVLVLLDACRSGGAMASGQALAADATRLRAALVGPNITVLTSSSAAELSREDPTWGNGAFTKIVLEALSSRGGREPQRPDQHQRAHRLPDAPRARLDRRRPAPWGGDALRRRCVRRRALRRRHAALPPRPAPPRPGGAVLGPALVNTSFTSVRMEADLIERCAPLVTPTMAPSCMTVCVGYAT